MKVNELIKIINESEEVNLKEILEIKEYLPVLIKKAIAHEIVYESTIEDNGFIKVDSFERYMSYVRHMIVHHTNLEYTDDDYDVMYSTMYGETSLLNTIMFYFGEDAEECSRILEMVMNDYMQESTIECTVGKLIHGISERISNLTNAITEKTNGVDLKSMIPDNIDMNKLGEFVKNYKK